MSLQVWLPLTKDLRQQGLLQTPAFSLSAFTQESGGKLGQYCYTDRGIIHFTEDFLANQWSLACWVKSTSWSANNDIILCKNASESTSSQFYLSIINGTSLNLGINGGSNNGAGGYSYTFSTNTWYHVAATYDGTNYTMYINGSQVKSGTCTTTKPTGLLNLGIGCRSTNAGGTASTGNANKRLNDVRIYNHCLSQKEVKELAKGLVLHYTLGDKAIESTTNLFYPLVETSRNTNPAWDKTLNGNYMIHCNGFGDGYNGGVSNPTTGYHGHWIYDENNNLMGILPNLNSVIGQTNRWLGLTATAPSTSIGAGNDYTISWEQKTDNLNCYVNAGYYYKKNSSESGYGSFYDGTKNCKNTIVNTWQPMEISFTLSQDWDGTYTGGTVYFYGHYGSEGTTYIRNLQFETKNHATAFVNGLTTRTSNTIYDCSGFCNNGEIINSLSISSDTPKYSVSTHISATNQKIHISNFPTSGFGNSYSFAWWGKRSSNSPMFWGFSDGIRLNGMYIGTLWNTGDGSSNPIYTPGTTTTITAPSLNTWHHYVMTGDGTTCNLYLDGELYGQAKTYKAISGTSIYINGWSSSTDYCSNDTSISDFRIYATALSASDVKSLYQNCATIDSDGTIRGQIRS